MRKIHHYPKDNGLRYDCGGCFARWPCQGEESTRHATFCDSCGAEVNATDHQRDCPFCDGPMVICGFN